MSAARLDAAVVLVRHAVKEASRSTTSRRAAAVHIDVAMAAVASIRKALLPGEVLLPELADLEQQLRGLHAQLALDGAP